MYHFLSQPQWAKLVSNILVNSEIYVLKSTIKAESWAPTAIV